MNNTIINQLDNIFKNINSWLNFAEAKNAALVALNSTLLFSLLKKQPEAYDFDFRTILFFVALLFLTVSLFTALLSFYPVLKIKKASLKGKDDLNKINLLFYGHIKDFSDKKYLEFLYKGFNINWDDNPSKIELDYVGQIIVNSKIAQRKYIFFRRALEIFLIGVFVFVLYLSLYGQSLESIQ